MQSRLTICVDAQAARQVEAFVAAFGVRHGLGADDQMRVCVVLEELVTNLIKYGYPKRSGPGALEIVLELEGARLTIELADDGRAFNPLAHRSALPAPGKKIEPLGGFGLRLVRRLTDEAHYRRSNNRNIVRLVWRVDLPGQTLL